MNVRDVVRIDLGAGSSDVDVERRRPGVVILLADKYVRVAYGSRTQPPPNVVAVQIPPDSRAGRALELRDTTWFQGANSAFERPSNLQLTGKHCPAELYFELVRMVRDHDAAQEHGE